MIVKFYYEQRSNQILEWVDNNSDATNIVEQIDDNSGVVIPIDDVELSPHEEIRPAKVYYYPNEDIYAYDFKKTEFRKSFDFYTFFHPTYITTPSFNFKYNGQDYTFLTNCEYALKFVFNDGVKLHIYFNADGNTNKIFKIEVGKKSYPAKFNVYIPPVDIVSYKLLDYLIFGNYRFFDKSQLPNIVEKKKWLIELLDGLDFYFIGTSIFEHARDIDIHINERDFDEAVKRLDKSVISYNDKVNYDGKQYRLSPDIKLDVINSPYSSFTEPKIGHDADPLLMYFIQTNYYCSIVKDHVSDLFKEYRYSKLLDTQAKVGLDFSRYKQFDNLFSYIENERLFMYLDIINNNDICEVFANIKSEKNIDTKLFCLNDIYYLIVSSKYNIAVSSKVTVPIDFTTFKVLDGDAVTEVGMVCENNNTCISFRNLTNYMMIELI